MIRRFIIGDRQPVVYSLTAIVASMFLVMFFNLWYTQREIVENNHKLCTVIVASDDAWRSFPPKTDATKKLADRMHDLREDYKC